MWSARVCEAPPDASAAPLFEPRLRFSGCDWSPSSCITVMAMRDGRAFEGCVCVSVCVCAR